MLFVVAVVAGGGYAADHYLTGGSSGSTAALPPCPAASTTPSVGGAARVVVRNATLKTGLAARVARQLRQRDFRVGKVGNTPFRGKGVATVRYSADRLQTAQLLAVQFPGAALDEVPGSGILEVDIGPKYRALRPAAQVDAAERAVEATPSPRATPSGKQIGRASCRERV